MAHVESWKHKNRWNYQEDVKTDAMNKARQHADWCARNNREVEAPFRELLFPCKWHRNGCNERFANDADALKHKPICRYRQYRCIYCHNYKSADYAEVERHEETCYVLASMAQQAVQNNLQATMPPQTGVTPIPVRPTFVEPVYEGTASVHSDFEVFKRLRLEGRFYDYTNWGVYQTGGEPYTTYYAFFGPNGVWEYSSWEKPWALLDSSQRKAGYGQARQPPWYGTGKG